MAGWLARSLGAARSLALGLSSKGKEAEGFQTLQLELPDVPLLC